MRKRLAAAVAVLVFALSACGTAATSEDSVTVDTPDGPVVCVKAAPAGGGAVAIDCNWEGK